MSNIESRTDRATDWPKRALTLLLALALALGLAACGKKTPEEQLARAQQARERNDVIGVEIRCQKVIEQAPKSDAAVQARFMLADQRLRTGQLEDARNLLNDIIAIAGLDSQFGQAAFQHKIQIWVHEKKYDEVIGHIEETSATLASTKDFAWKTQLVLAQVYIQKEDRKKAFEIYNVLLNAASTEAYARVAMDEMVGLHVQGEKPDYNAAIALYQRHIDKYEDSKFYGHILQSIGQCHQKIAESLKDEKAKEAEEKKAEEVLTRCLEYFQKEMDEELITDKKTQLAMQIVSLHHIMENPEKALATLEDIGKRVAKEAPGKPMPLGLTVRIAETLVELEKPEEALERLEKGVKDYAADPNRGMLMQLIVDIHDDADNTTGTRKWLEKMKNEFPMTNVSTIAEGRLMVLDNKYADAIKLFEEMGDMPRFKGTVVEEQANGLIEYVYEKMREAGLTTGTATLSTATLSTAPSTATLSIDGATTPTAADTKSSPTAAGSGL